MKTDVELNATATAPNVVQLTTTPRPRREPAAAEVRFKVKEFQNASGTKSYRVDGYKRDGARVRENYADLIKAKARQIELETEWIRGNVPTELQATKLTREQVSLAEAAFLRLGPDAWQELSLAIEHWIRHGRQSAVRESPRLDDAFRQFCGWLPSSDSELRELSQKNLRRRVNVFVNSVPNMRVADATPDTIDGYLDKRSISKKSKDNDRRAISRFFSWCIERPRRWASMNPCREVKVLKKKKNEGGGDAQPAVLSVNEAEVILREAESFEEGRLAPYVAVCLFGGLRPFEAARLTWDAVNLTDGEIRLEAGQTKTGMPRVVTICPTLKAWLEAHKGKPFFPSNWRKDFDVVKLAAGFGTPNDDHRKLKPWPVDVLRHTAVSHFFRETGSYGRTAEQFGNSEGIIKNHYQGRVSSEDTKKFYAIMPKKGGRK